MVPAIRHNMCGEDESGKTRAPRSQAKYTMSHTVLPSSSMVHAEQDCIIISADEDTGHDAAQHRKRKGKERATRKTIMSQAALQLSDDAERGLLQENQELRKVQPSRTVIRAV